jgi:hypothetical protein
MSPAIWLAMARDDLRAAELLQEHGLPPLSRMHADHAVEKALRAFYLHRERQADEGSAGSEPRSPFPSPSLLAPRGTGGDRSRQAGGHPLASGLGEDTGWIAAALASLSLRAEHRQPVSQDTDAELAREAVQVAHEVLDRITERVYGDP